MNPTSTIERRGFLGGLLATGVSTRLGFAKDVKPAGQALARKQNATTSNLEHCVFTKPFNSLSFEELAEQIAALGFQGIEAPIRRGGHVEPDAVATELPRLVRALESQGLKITVMTSDISSLDSSHAKTVLRTAADLGVERFRMAYFRYEPKRPVLEQNESWRRPMETLAEYCGKIGIQALYQNHAGAKYMGAAIWDLHRLIVDIDPEHLAVAYDLRHAMVEGGTSWPTAWRLIEPHVRTIYVKDYDWKDGRVANVPLGSGQVQPSFYRELLQAGYSGPISLHEEYLDHRKPELVPEHINAINQDFDVLRSWLSDA
ncbi:MAG: sugar phosphate isomerase/epimerase family protein [Planctomycetota bacterium]